MSNRKDFSFIRVSEGDYEVYRNETLVGSIQKAVYGRRYGALVYINGKSVPMVEPWFTLAGVKQEFVKRWGRFNTCV